MGTWNINKDLILVKLHFFLFNAALSGTIPFLPVYAKQLGISALRVGIIFTFLSFLGLVTKPTFGAVADRFRHVKFMLIALLAVIVITMLGLNFITPVAILNSDDIFRCASFNETDNSTHTGGSCKEFCILCGNCSLSLSPNYTSFTNSNVFPTNAICSNWTDGFSCDRWCDVDKVGAEEETDEDEYYDAGPTLQYALFTTLIVGAWASFNVAVTLTDSACYTMLEDKPHLYGQQRLWGVIGWGIFAALTGYLNNIATGDSPTYDYSPGFYLLVILLLLDMITVRHLKIKTTLVPKSLFKNMKKLLTDPKITVFLIGTFAIGALTGLIRCYLFWYLRLLRGSQLLLGLASGAQCFLGELPFFFFSGWIIKKLGHVNTVIMAFSAYSIRFLGYYFMRNPSWTLLLELLQGPAYAVFYAAMTSFAKTVAFPGTEATVQGLLGGTFEGLGIATGNLLGGVGFSLIGGRRTFLCAAAVALFGSISFAVAQKLFNTSASHNSRVLATPDSSSNDNEWSAKANEPLRSKQLHGAEV